MGFSQGSRSALGYITEVTYGITPATPTLAQIPFNTHSLDLTRQTLTSAEIRPDRMTNILRLGNYTAVGDFMAELRAVDYDHFLESAFFGTLTSGVLKAGVTRKSFTFEDQAQDISQFRVYTGCMITSAEFSVKPNAMVTTKFTIVGQTMTQGATSVSGSALTAPSTNIPFDSFTGIMKEGGATSAILAGVDFKIDNGLKPTFVIGSKYTPALEYGLAKVTGTLTAYYQDAVMLNKFLNETESSLEFNLTDGTNNYKFKMGRVKYTGGSVPVASDVSRMITLPFEALLNVSDGTNLVLTIT
jgi:hypothetical protein